MPHCCRWCSPSSSSFCPFSRVLPPVSGSRVDPALKCDPTRPAPVGAAFGLPAWWGMNLRCYCTVLGCTMVGEGEWAVDSGLCFCFQGIPSFYSRAPLPAQSLQCPTGTLLGLSTLQLILQGRHASIIA